MGQKELSPIAIIEEEISEFDSPADEFHSGSLSDLHADQRKSCCPLRAA